MSTPCDCTPERSSGLLEDFSDVKLQFLPLRAWEGLMGGKAGWVTEADACVAQRLPVSCNAHLPLGNARLPDEVKL